MAPRAGASPDPGPRHGPIPRHCGFIEVAARHALAPGRALLDAVHAASTHPSSTRPCHDTTESAVQHVLEVCTSNAATPNALGIDAILPLAGSSAAMYLVGALRGAHPCEQPALLATQLHHLLGVARPLHWHGSASGDDGYPPSQPLRPSVLAARGGPSHNLA